MLPKSALQTIAACMVYDDNISKPAKIRLVRFIELASEKQLQHFIIHGTIVENKDVHVEANFFRNAAIIGTALAVGRAIYSNEFSKAAKACAEMKGDEKKICMKRFKIRGTAGKISALRKEMGNCNQTSRPDKCRKMFVNYIRNAEKQMKKIQAD